jgi:hypothetical protein
MIRIWLMAMLAAALLVVARNYDLMHRTHLLSSCTTHGAWSSCHRGLLDGRPEPSGRSCRRVTRSGSTDYWRCRRVIR